jgi:nitrile hydratase subunit beta
LNVDDAGASDVVSKEVSMNSGHDLGGMMGFGPVAAEKDEPVFHAPWERRAFGMTLAMGATGSWSIDTSRQARESLNPAEYLNSSYYEIWIKGLTKLLLSQGLVSIHEIYGDEPIAEGRPVKHVARAEAVPELLANGTPYTRPARAPARFEPGDPVRVRNDHPAGHTRSPRYLRGRQGTIVAVNGVFVFPDSNARGEGEDPHWCYSVRFIGRELWGREADPTLTVTADLWEPYLETA